MAKNERVKIPNAQRWKQLYEEVEESVGRCISLRP